jgi:hypothetical protein
MRAFEITGALWVEADTNLPGVNRWCGNFYSGKEAIERHLGQRTTVL